MPGMSDVHLIPVDEDILDTILADDVEFHGTLQFKLPLMIKGKMSGAVDSTSDLYIDEHAEVEANIVARNVAVRGYLKGNIRATGKVELFNSATVHGDVTAREIAIEPGCNFNGICLMNNHA
jgi:cytoskeletal protein CcmA (bactofilin family)